MLKIGTVKLSSPYILAPMAGISDLPFRMLNRRFGCELAFVEMINVRSISYKSRKTKQMLSTNKNDRPLGVQLLGCEPKFIRKALDVLNGYNFDVLDFNAACPAKKVIRRGEGARLLCDPAKLQQLLKLIVSYAKVPVTVKIRSGWDSASVNAKTVALAAQDAGVSAVFIHGRTRSQGYGGRVDYEVIRKVKKALEVPVIASGDIFSQALIKKMFDETGCDAVAIARGALGNPWIFKGTQPQIEELVDVMGSHLSACIDFYGEKGGAVIFRKFFAWYTKGLYNVRHLRQKATSARTRQEFLNIIEELYDA